MSVSRLLIIAAVATSATLSWGQMPRRAGEPSTGYIYPAGARQGTTVHAVVGGQYLKDVSAVHITGVGVQGKAVDYGRPLSNKQLGDVAMHLRVLMRQRWAEAMGKPGTPMMQKDPGKDEELEPLPDHPWLRGLDKKSLQELDALRMLLFNPKKQPNAQLGEMAFLDLTVGATATPGLRQIRLETPNGLSSPINFVVGTVPEVMEREPNSRDTEMTALALPVVVDGQIMPGDVDVCRFKARRGQKLVITTQARSLVPYLADAVPGWFQAVVTLYDGQGAPVAFGDDYRFDPDPVLFYQVPQDGEYALEIHDSIYRGREDFVYRIAIGEQPFVTGVFPLGGTAGQPLTARLTGWNLPTTAVQLDTAPGGLPVRQASWQWPNGRSNTVAYAVDALPTVTETEPNEAGKPQQVSRPQAIAGRIGKPGDVDAYRFEGQAGEAIVLDVQARRLGSPLDSLLRLTDAAGQTIALNDDHDDGQSPLLTHHADSWLSVKLPKTGTYTVTVSDTQQHGGDEHAYRLCVRPPRPDFALRLTPSSLRLAAGRTTPLVVHALRQDGFAGPIDLAVAGMSTGFVLSGGRIPAGQNLVHLTVTAPAEPPKGPAALQIVGKADVGGTTVTRAAVPTDEMMQAFAYWHLVPAEQFAVLVAQPPRWAPNLQVVGGAPVRLAAGGTAQVEVKAPPVPALLKGLRLELKSAPDGVTLKEQKALPSGVSLVLQGDGAKLKAGPADNVIIEAFIETEVKRGDGKTATVRNSVGVLPAVPVEVVP